MNWARGHALTLLLWSTVMLGALAAVGSAIRWKEQRHAVEERYDWRLCQCPR